MGTAGDRKEEEGNFRIPSLNVSRTGCILHPRPPGLETVSNKLIQESLDIEGAALTGFKKTCSLKGGGGETGSGFHPPFTSSS